MKYVNPISIRHKALACGVYIHKSYFCTRSASEASTNECLGVMKSALGFDMETKIQTIVCIRPTDAKIHSCIQSASSGSTANRRLHIGSHIFAHGLHPYF